MTSLSHSKTAPFLPHILTIGLHKGPWPSTACSSTRTHLLPVHPPSDWLRLFLSQTFSCINIPTVSSWIFLVNCLQRSVTRRLNEWRNDQWSATLESLNPEVQSLWRMTKRVMRVPTPSPPRPGHPRGNRSLRL